MASRRRCRRSGTTSTASVATMTPVDNQSRAVLRARGCGRSAGSPSSGSQRFPSQNMSWALLSVTRLTPRVPWLCGPASRRVCHFEEADQIPVRSAGALPSALQPA